MYIISQLFIYPIKSLGGIEVKSALLTDRGLQYDRRWMLVDAANCFLTQREYPVMSLLQPAIENDQLIIYHKNNIPDKVILPLQPPPEITIKVKVWDDECEAQYVSEIADVWFSDKLSMHCRLVYMPESEKRKVDERYARENDLTNFSDGYPLMMIGQASLDDLNGRLEEPLPINRFRPNIVFTGGQPYDEDIMEHVAVAGIDLYGVKISARCIITGINQTNAIKGKEPLKTLAGYRMINNKVYFGQNILFDQTGHLKVGDTIEMISSKAPVLFTSAVNPVGTEGQTGFTAG
ncbi:MAG: MOSC N-terminal beta barrel domain-containing protein [Ferruginibacter sp.]